MSNPWKEVFEEVRYNNGNDYEYLQNLAEEDDENIDRQKVQQAVYAIKRLARQKGINMNAAIITYFASHQVAPQDRAAIRAKLMSEETEYIEENPQAIGRGYQNADRNLAKSLGAAQMAQQRLDAQRQAQKQKQQQQQRLTTGGSTAQFQSNSYEPEGEELQEKITKSTPAAEVIRDFIKSKDPRFKGASKKERIKRALGAYYAKQRNEELETFVEEKYGEKYEKKYGPSTGKNTVGNLDGDDNPNEPDAHEYAGVKDRAIKNAIKKRMKSESSNWREEVNFFTK